MTTMPPRPAGWPSMTTMLPRPAGWPSMTTMLPTTSSAQAAALEPALSCAPPAAGDAGLLAAANAAPAPGGGGSSRWGMQPPEQEGQPPQQRCPDAADADESPFLAAMVPGAEGAVGGAAAAAAAAGWDEGALPTLLDESPPPAAFGSLNLGSIDLTGPDLQLAQLLALTAGQPALGGMYSFPLGPVVSWQDPGEAAQ